MLHVYSSCYFLSATYSNEKMNSFFASASLHRGRRPSVAGAYRAPQIYKQGPRHDPSRRIRFSSILLFRCSLCKRIQEKAASARHYFHVCCHPFEMKYIGTKEKNMDTQQKLINYERVWDFHKSLPKYGMTRPRPKGRSKFKK